MLSTSEKGKITEIEELDNGYVLWIGEDGIEIGISVYREDLKKTPGLGDTVTAEWADTPSQGLAYLEINGLVQFKRTSEIAGLYHSMRVKQREAQLIKDRICELER